ncbi:TetR/AcrR family transcriptional regulator [Qaidamihabitans albus]|uniref:TetR/AcrR family transcriptional regulator n=1 Tax=Qaidamihabitans albus TaxID=2795733 RepID=UPI0018F25A6C|nr:TetR/AcrR family transcriptional regulator [Qaidamihabitans albus]
MVATSEASAGRERAPLSRRRIIDAAARYIDTHGLEGLSMHKLGAELDVKAMSLYNHVANKDDLLDGVMELFWEEVESNAPAKPDWREGYRSFAHALRDTVHRHARSARLSASQRTMPEPALRCLQAHVGAATNKGVPEECAYALLRTITSYALGTALVEATWGIAQAGCRPVTSVSDLVRPGIPEELVGVAQVFCIQSDPEAHFELGLDLMLRDTGDTWELVEKVSV